MLLFSHFQMQRVGVKLIAVSLEMRACRFFSVSLPGLGLFKSTFIVEDVEFLSSDLVPVSSHYQLPAVPDAQRVQLPT